ncbi:hypothetical protein H6F88_00560 [Oculatella sp. FACHB-28]|uniref:hypothetical protein n=1 Tax=Oculatella sp. FACHB-28 TaxID=2692845 RepID=UPI001684DDA9|nr:hypothetical protein [Oculatella sp. FACHB-28]MBD2054538.1 hypothetical protein [Oculatella sp. FACHB-28]
MPAPSSEIVTLESAYWLYVKCFPDKAARLKTALFRYLLPYKGFGFDFQIEQGELCSRGEKSNQGWELAKRVKLEDLWEIKRVLSWQEEVFDSLNSSLSVRRPNKHYLRHFLTWCKDQGYLKVKQPETWEVPRSLPDKSKAYHQRGKREHQLILNRQPLIEYRANPVLFSDEMKRQFREFSAFWTDQNYEGIRPIPKTIDKSTFESLLDRTLALIGWLTLDKLDYHRRMCERARLKKQTNADYESGWLSVDPEPPDWLQEMHKKYPPRALNTLDLEELVPLVEIRPEKLVIKEDEYIEQNDNNNVVLKKIQKELETQNASLSFETIAQLVQSLHQNQNFVEEVKKLNRIAAKANAQEEAKALMNQACEKVRSLLKAFFKWLQYQHNPSSDPDEYRITPNYRAGFCNVLMSLSKFRYREVTDSRKCKNYTDIEVVVELRNIRQEEVNSEFKPNSVNPVKQNPTWKELGQLLKELLIACAPRRRVDSKPDYRNMGPLRPQTAVAQDFQKYLIMMFFRLISPDRQHVVRELKQHDTLKLCWINWETRRYVEAPWDKQAKQYKAYYNSYTKLYYLNIEDVKDEKGNVVEFPQGQSFSWLIYLDASQTKINKDNAYRVPKIYNPELEAWLHGREDFSDTWFNWPPIQGKRNKWNSAQHHWCGYIDLEDGKRKGFREAFNPQHDFVFTQANGKPFSTSNLCRFYDAILWRFLGIRSNPHAVRSTVTGHFKLKGMTDAESEALAKLKSHSVRMQDSPAYNRLASLEETARASEMIVNDFLKDQGLDPEEYGLV